MLPLEHSAIVLTCIIENQILVFFLSGRLSKFYRVFVCLCSNVSSIWCPQGVCGGGGGVYSDIFTHRRLGPFFGAKILNFNIFGSFQQKKNTFWGMKILWIFLGGDYTIGLVLWVITMYFWVFS